MVIRVVRIGDSAPAPNFELVVQPNDWEKEVKRATLGGPGEASLREKTYREFWEHVLERVRSTHPDWTRARTSNASWVNLPTGTAHAVFSLAWVGGTLVSQLYFESNDADLNLARFEALHERKAEFDAALGEEADWDPMEGRKGARVIVASPFSDLDDRESWHPMVDWIIATQLKFRSALSTVGGIPETRT